MATTCSSSSSSWSLTRVAVAAWLCAAVFSLHFSAAVSNEFSVGGDKGWVIPKEDNPQFYNDWASKNRFKVDDTLKFEYRKDSVLEVSKEEYEKCRSSGHPIFFDNREHTSFKLDRSGLFYFISGVSGHCERGQKMIVKVLETENPPQPGGNQPADGNSPPASGGAAAVLRGSPVRFVFFSVSLLGSTIFINAM
ncbi:unnamed protein product [Cuscuta campestris]|uniref:Phytocyanin domain-containing protein n=1 Tax=Cuscuta campestris TaxID=132261 RepID=A0A484MEM3_9ASTE|nr:unnamed protein product [Cuscuta campestris]